VTSLCLHFRWSRTITLTSTSLRMGDYIPWACIARGFLRVLYDTLIRLGYDGDAPVYYCRVSMVHNLDKCVVSVMIPLDPAHPWSGSVIGSEPDIGVEMMVHITLSSLCEDRLAATAALPIALSRLGIRRTPYGSSALRPCPTLRALTFLRG
jgi:hypothetical protein